MSIVDTQTNLFSYIIYFLFILNISLLIGFTIINPSVVHYIENGILICTSLFLIYKFYDIDTVKITKLDNRIIYHLAIVIVFNTILIPVLNQYKLNDKFNSLLEQTLKLGFVQ